MKKSLIPFILLTMALAGCQPTPERAAVTSKNDGAFQAALAAAPAPEITAEPTPAPERWEDSFANAAGDVRYSVSLEAPAAADAPVLTVRPRPFTSEEAERIARAFFGQGDIYRFTDALTREEIEERILAYRQTISQWESDWEGLVANCGGQEEAARQMVREREDSIAALEAMYDSAPDSVRPELCDWQFRPGSEWIDPAATVAVYLGDQVIKASAVREGLGYVLIASNTERDASGGMDFRVSIGLDERDSEGYAQAMEPLAEGPADLETVQAKALEMAEAMDMGRWEIVDPEAARAAGEEALVSSFRTVVLTRVYEGTPTLCHQGPLAGPDTYWPSCAYERVTVRFNGLTPVSFEYRCPTDVLETVSGEVETLPFDRIAQAAEDQLRRMDSQSLYPFGSPCGGAVSGTDVAVDRAAFGMTRVRMRDSVTDYYMVPSYTFYGTAAPLDGAGNRLSLSPEGGTAEDYLELVTVNAVDGSIINTLWET